MLFATGGSSGGLKLQQEKRQRSVSKYEANDV